MAEETTPIINEEHQVQDDKTTTITITGEVNPEKMSMDAWEEMKGFFTQDVIDMVDRMFSFNGEDENDEQGKSDESQLDSSTSSQKGSSCSKNIVGVDDYQCSDGQCHNTPETPKYKMEIEVNDLPENWWDKIPDFDPRIYDAIALEQAAACVDYIFDVDVHELENRIETRKFRKTGCCTKVQVPRTKVKKPKEIRYDTKIDDYIKKDRTY